MMMENYQSRFATTLIISIILHIVAILSTPEFMKFYTLPKFKEEIIEIERIKVPKKKIEVKKEEIKKKEKVMTKVGKEEYIQIPSSVERVIDGKIKEIKLGEKFTPPPPLVDLPAISKEQTQLKSPVTFKKYMPPDQIKKFEPEGSTLIGNIFGKKKEIPLPIIKAETKFHIKQAVVSDNFKVGEKEIIGREPELQIREKNLKLGLKGEIIDRDLESRPKQLPAVKIDIPVTVVLDFEVMPDGTVTKIRPKRRVDVNLERIAIDYLKRWKFSNLPMDAAQKNQKGILTVKFELE